MIIYRIIDFGSEMKNIKPKIYNNEDYIEIKDSLEYEIDHISLVKPDEISNEIINYIKNLP